MTIGFGAAERDAWITLAAADGIGELRFHQLVAGFGGALAVLEAVRGRSAEQIQASLRPFLHGTLPKRTADRVAEAAADPGRVHERMAELDVWALTPMEAAYPPELRELDPPPAVLFGVGSTEVLAADRRIAVVGTRRPTLAGRALAARVARRLVDCDCVVVSGLAIGIDGAAHAATVEADGRTIAVIGGGHANPGPRAHRKLVDGILEGGGALVGELAPDATASKGTFPRRNRIISVLSQATLVIEAPVRSGALITARHALEQGREVLAAPGRPGDPATAGCLALIRETPARPLIGLDELVVDLGLDRAAVRVGAETRPLGAASLALSAETALSLLGPAERAVAERLRQGPATADALIVDTGLPPAVTSGAITLLLLRGWAQALGPAYLPAGPLLGTSPT
ncbi:MAG: processing protein [Chloroflexota bacterium]|nr:processing protein [Chloroflexota bacterium]